MDLKVINYSTKAIAVIGDTRPFKVDLKELGFILKIIFIIIDLKYLFLGGKFNNRLNVEGETVVGWIFPSSFSSKVNDFVSSISNGTKAAASSPKSVKSPTPPKIVKYSEKSFVVLGDTKPIKDKLKEMGGKFNPCLNCESRLQPGWIFPLNKQDVIQVRLNV